LSERFVQAITIFNSLENLRLIQAKTIVLLASVESAKRLSSSLSPSLLSNQVVAQALLNATAAFLAGWSDWLCYILFHTCIQYAIKYLEFIVNIV
jgi:hypothetical protein